ncbi:hypothetical protein NQ317_002142 [Molorchus minor]|uniref:tRNA (guanine(37)-N1)-methyltransferase n=1 Tax=Molorchus minor TaxID=1323400 RepID=A0ABQ9JX86_9CUCU|nr:hypothetical protein NQ317_002142 [Molorchus minor]
MNILKPPEVREITSLDKKLFQKEVQLPCLTLKDMKLSQIVPHNTESEVRIFLDPEKVSAWTSLTEDARKVLNDLKVDETNLKKVEYVLQYENFTADDVLKSVLPPDKEGKHVKLHKGEILYDKVHGCKSVVNKTNMIDNTYRNFKMEVLKGDDDMLTTVKENGCTFKFDFSKVYWNSRLCTEHERIVNKVNSGDVVFDVFAGVGPFSVPLAKKKCYVYANDLNPDSYNWLNHNAKANKLNETYFKSFNKDGGEFIREDIKKYLPDCLNNKQNVYIVMNLPALAVQFLKDFIGLLKNYDTELNFSSPPIVFVYCFAKGEDYVAIAKSLVIENFGFDVSDKIVDVFKVRTVSSMKEMMRVTIKLDGDLLVGDLPKKRKLEEGLELGNKKINVGVKVEDTTEDVGNRQGLVHLENKIRKGPVKLPKPDISSSKLPTINDEDVLETQKKLEEATQVLHNI